MHFNSHAHVERDLGKYPLRLLLSYFNSHAHVERDIYGKGTEKATNISTHTLTWSVTDPRGWVFFSFIISTHTLTWSVTTLRCSDNHQNGISTHTLTWSVTIFRKSCLVGRTNFNSHAHVERDWFLGTWHT